MRTRLIALSCCIALTAMLAYAQTGDFQPATVVSIDKMASDAQHPEYGDHYRIGMRIGDTISPAAAAVGLRSIWDGPRTRNFRPKSISKPRRLR